MNSSLQAAGGHWWAGGGGTCGGQTRHVSSPHGAWDCPALPERACQAPPRSARGRKQGCRVPVLQMRKHRACRSDSLSMVAQLRTGVSSTQPQVCFLRRGLRVSVQRDAGERPRTPGPESGAWAFPSVSGLLGLLTVRRSLGGVVAKGASARSGSNARGLHVQKTIFSCFLFFAKERHWKGAAPPSCWAPLYTPIVSLGFCF